LSKFVLKTNVMLKVIEPKMAYTDRIEKLLSKYGNNWAKLYSQTFRILL